MNLFEKDTRTVSLADLDEIFFNHVVEGFMALYKVPGTCRQLHDRLRRKVGNIKQAVFKTVFDRMLKKGEVAEIQNGMKKTSENKHYTHVIFKNTELKDEQQI